jgi:hypothetical protein
MIILTLLAIAIVGGALVVCLPLLLAFGIHHIPGSQLVGTQLSTQQRAVRLEVVRTFLDGMAEGIRGHYPPAQPRLNDVDYLTPFRVEGLCTGLSLAGRLRPWGARKALAEFLNLHQRYRFLLVLGKGFARGVEVMWRGPMRSEPRIPVDRLDALYADGYGFQQMVFHYVRNPSVLSQGLRLEDRWRAGFYEGAGRALWFLKRDTNDFLAALSGLPAECRSECEIGYGIAAGFAGVRQVSQTQFQAPGPDSTSFKNIRVGLVIGLFARYDVDAEYTSSLLRSQDLHKLLMLVEQVHESFIRLWAMGFEYYAWRNEIMRLVQDSANDAFADHLDLAYGNAGQSYAR